MSGGYDSIWLQLNGQGNPWIFVRKGKQLEIFQAINTAQADEVPSCGRPCCFLFLTVVRRSLVSRIMVPRA